MSSNWTDEDTEENRTVFIGAHQSRKRDAR